MKKEIFFGVKSVMQKNIDDALINEYEKNLDLKQVYKVSNILYNTSLYQASYNPIKLNQINRNFAIDLIGLPVENQKKSGRCWLFAATNFIREQIAKKLNLPNFSLSNAYLAFWDKIERSNFFLNVMINHINDSIDDRLIDYFLKTGIEDGGQWDMVVNLIAKYGIVPYEVMKDSKQAGETASVNYLLNWKLRDFAATLRNTADKSITNLTVLKESMMQEIFKLLLTFYGNIPTTFNFEYSRVRKNKNSDFVDSYQDICKDYVIDKNLTPQMFYEKYVDIKLDQFISIIHAPQTSKEFYKLYTIDYLNNVIEKNSVLHCNLDLPLFKYLIINQLINHLPVWFGSDVSWFRDLSTGSWDDSLFEVDKLFDTSFEVFKGDQLSYRISFMTHAMLIVGINFDVGKFNNTDFFKINDLNQFSKAVKDLNISWWKIENSWGNEIGNHGYWNISDSWFDKYTYQAVVLKSKVQALLKQLNLPPLEKMEVKHLDPWDPIGTLA